MNVYSWKMLVAYILIGGGYFIYIILHFKGFMDFFWLVLLAYIIIQGICVSISKEEYEAYLKKVAEEESIYRKLFGKFAPLAPYGAFIPMLLSFAVAKTAPTLEWLIMILILSAFAYEIWILSILKKHTKIEAEKDKANCNKIQ